MKTLTSKQLSNLTKKQRELISELDRVHKTSDGDLYYFLRIIEHHTLEKQLREIAPTESDVDELVDNHCKKFICVLVSKLSAPQVKKTLQRIETLVA